MKRRSAYILLVFIFALFFGVSEYLTTQTQDVSELEFVLYPDVKPVTTRDIGNDDALFTIGLWNLQIFGESKAANATLLGEYVDVMSAHDIFIVQEIRNKDGTAFETLCSLMQQRNYSCIVSSRAGSSSSKEQYGIFYRTAIQLNSIYDYTLVLNDSFERPPFEATFLYNDVTFTLTTIHVKPTEVYAELTELETLYGLSNSTILLGDFNADCSYYTPGSHFSQWGQIISSKQDTTVSKTDCAYDKIMLSPDLVSYYAGIYGITTEDITLALSDHYPVWVSLDI